MPGRVCLFGEHSDWAAGYRRSHSSVEKGYTLICGTEQGLYAHVEPLADCLELTATYSSESGRPRERRQTQIQFSAEHLLNTAASKGFWSYIAGTAFQIQKRFAVEGLRLQNYRTDLPIQKGLSSSAAVCVLTARAFNQVYGLNLTIEDEMELAYLGEVTTGSQCGRMDQACAFGRQPVLQTFDGDSMLADPVQAGKPIHLVVVDLQGKKDTRRILADLHTCYPDATEPTALGVQKLFGSLNKQMVFEAVQALEAGQAETLGQLMTAAQAQFDYYARPASPAQLEAPHLHEVLDDPQVRAMSWGGKGIGAQGDGSAQIVARHPEAQKVLIEHFSETYSMPAFNLTINP